MKKSTIEKLFGTYMCTPDASGPDDEFIMVHQPNYHDPIMSSGAANETDDEETDDEQKSSSDDHSDDDSDDDYVE